MTCDKSCIRFKVTGKESKEIPTSSFMSSREVKQLKEINQTLKPFIPLCSN